MLYYAKVETTRMCDGELLATDDKYINKEEFYDWSYDTRWHHIKKFHIENDGIALKQKLTLQEPWFGGDVIECDFYDVRAGQYDY